MKQSTKITLAVIVLILIGSVIIKLLWFPVSNLHNAIDMTYYVNNQIVDGKTALREYEWFKQQDADIGRCFDAERIAQSAYDKFVALLPQNRADWSENDKREERSLAANITACEQITNRAIGDYNARASMVSRNVFKDNLPATIDRAYYTSQKLTNGGN